MKPTKLTLNRDVFNKNWTQGKLYVDDNFLCYTLEDKDRFLEVGSDDCKDCTKVAGITAIPRGKYKLVISFSNRFKKRMPEVLNVPQFTGIRIHAGNKHQDTEGCILVGMDRQEDGTITQSAIAFAQLMKILEIATDIEIEIK